jgi:hypothetical protein
MLGAPFSVLEGGAALTAWLECPAEGEDHAWDVEGVLAVPGGSLSTDTHSVRWRSCLASPSDL